MQKQSKQMKKNIFSCPSCGEEVKTANRDAGRIPIQISCENKECNGMAVSKDYKVSQKIDFDFIFIKPRNNKEWQIIEKQVTDDVEETFPEHSRLDKKKMRDNFLTMLKEHSKKGGLIHLKKSLVTLP